jgi:hypothetical protein
MSPNYKYRFLSEPATVDVSYGVSRVTLILSIYYEPNMRRASPLRAALTTPDHRLPI